MTTTAIIVAGGSGTRFGRPKHKQKLYGIELWQRSVDVFRSVGIQQIVVVGDVPGGVHGGPRRRDSVVNGLAVVPQGTEWVLVHDAARPLVTAELIERVLERVLADDVDGVIPAVPLSDTIKRIDGEFVEATVDRSNLVAVQTPQAFRFATLADAHERDHEDATDDAALVERAGGTVVHVPGDPMNIKITYPVDLDVASALLAARASHA
jgi:2-C-methyl-D-erythritol 4-phosphate cytidylyltransferase